MVTTAKARREYEEKHLRMFKEKKVGARRGDGEQETLHLHPGTTAIIRFNYGGLPSEINVNITGTNKNLTKTKPILEELIGFKLRRINK